MSQHTPGPWNVDAETVYDTTHARICTVDYGDDDEATITGAGEQAPGQGRANARLIAAAPDLLAACELARKITASTHPNTLHRGEICGVLDAAISKATT